MLRRLFVLAVAGVVAACSATARAADHADGPSATQSLMDLTGDITDVYAFTRRNNVNLIMDVGANSTATSKFSNAIQYVFHVNGITGLTDSAPLLDDGHLHVRCVAEDVVLACSRATRRELCHRRRVGDGGREVGRRQDEVFAGPRNDPFFFNIQGFRKVTGFVARTWRR